MFTYKYSPKANIQQFKKAQQYLEHTLNLKSIREVVDVDGSRIQSYKFRGRDLFVILDVDFDSIIVKSEIDIPAFPRRRWNRKLVGSTKPTSGKTRKEKSLAMTKSHETRVKRSRLNQLRSASD